MYQKSIYLPENWIFESALVGGTNKINKKEAVLIFWDSLIDYEMVVRLRLKIKIQIYNYEAYNVR